mmetsp:Transcript_17060/g.30491  ORF Transcript_17060/g.30491 Transcript_17060/m.30491 type:complete len:263 (+) Transcript_17060:846-1634(+)
MGSPTCAGWPATADRNASPEPALPQLPDELEAFLAPDDANLPVVLFTLGSMSSIMDPNNLTELLGGLCNAKWKTMAALSAKAVSRVPAELLQHPNLLVSSWIPQAQVIADPRVNVVVTHCGWGAALDVVTGGKPVVCVPHHGDQPVNADLLVSKGMGLKLNFKTVKATGVEKTVSALLTDPKYSQRAQELSKAVAAETCGRHGAVTFVEQLVAEDRARRDSKHTTDIVPAHRPFTAALIGGAAVVAIGAAVLAAGLRTKGHA